MAWIAVHQGLFRHPKTLRLASLLNISPICASGHVISLWCWCLEYAESGDLTDFSETEIAYAAEWSVASDVAGESSAKSRDFVVALQSAKFLDEKKLHQWTEYQGRLIVGRQKKRERDRLRLETSRNKLRLRTKHPQGLADGQTRVRKSVASDTANVVASDSLATSLACRASTVQYNTINLSPPTPAQNEPPKTAGEKEHLSLKATATAPKTAIAATPEHSARKDGTSHHTHTNKASGAPANTDNTALAMFDEYRSARLGGVAVASVPRPETAAAMERVLVVGCKGDVKLFRLSLTVFFSLERPGAKTADVYVMYADKCVGMAAKKLCEDRAYAKRVGA